MLNHEGRPGLLFAALVVGIAATASCTAQTARTVLYGPDFKDLTAVEVETTMHAFAEHVTAIDELLHKKPIDQTAVVDHLKGIEEAAGELALTGQASEHPIFDRYLDDLRLEVAQARISAEGDPPNYIPAAQVIGSCLACHRQRRYIAPDSPQAVTMRAVSPSPWADSPMMGTGQGGGSTMTEPSPAGR